MMPRHLPSTRSARFQLGLSLACVVCAPYCIGAAEGTARSSPEMRERVTLNGQWDFFPDVGEATLETVRRDGVIQRGKIQVPGAWQAQGYGSPGGVIPSSVIGPDLPPAGYLRHNLTARCLYVRQVDVPQTWSTGRLFLCVRRAYRYADVTVNGKRIGTEKTLQRSVQFSEVTTDNGLHLILCSLDLLSNKPESRYVLAETIKHLLAGKPSRLAAQCAAAELEALLR